jgi:hypothetical protein
MSQLLSKEQAARYCGLPRKFLSMCCKRGTGPTFIRPSQKTMFFRPEDLDRWIRTWKRSAQTAE